MYAAAPVIFEGNQNVKKNRSLEMAENRWVSLGIS